MFTVIRCKRGYDHNFCDLTPLTEDDFDFIVKDHKWQTTIGTTCEFFVELRATLKENVRKVLFNALHIREDGKENAFPSQQFRLVTNEEYRRMIRRRKESKINPARYKSEKSLAKAGEKLDAEHAELMKTINGFREDIVKRANEDLNEKVKNDNEYYIRTRADILASLENWEGLDEDQSNLIKEEDDLRKKLTKLREKIHAGRVKNARQHITKSKNIIPEVKKVILERLDSGKALHESMRHFL